ncbi:MAG: 50S ribosome-binding GTPase [Chloroflexi bacterium]|nr:50S ribosome-binding GTPase [Chloroflexota bacterium]MCI0575305.1 50S ribosome-binding GTPase [Chloroflexota bacterium]MCI0647627.1 50S ribosome-binding GTPase [Chloroflexota bacterium]MCI0731264.1 50S ribosome-binding GTPase [Chloroflexota bacterium]
MTDDRVDDLLQEFPEESRQVLRAAWEVLPLHRREELLALVPLLPGQPGKIHKLFELAGRQLAMSFGNKHQVAIVGPANVGKSTLYNQLIESRKDAAVVSPVPGTTRDNQAASAGPFTVIDTPGADAVGEVGERERRLALAAAAGADFLVILFDAVQGIKRTEQELFKELVALKKPYIVVLNKIDLVRRHVDQAVVQAAANLGLPPDDVIPIVATSGKNVEQVLLAIVKAEPALVAALGQGLPAYRWQLAWRVITGAASTSALIALTPLPFLDFVPLVAVQSSLILGIARIYNYKITPGRARELIGVFGGGFLGRTLFYELTKLGGPPAWVVAAAVAAGTTVAMGYGAILWFERGERLTRESAGRISRAVAATVAESLKNLGRRKPSRKKLSEQIRETLEQSPLAEDRLGLDEVAQTE